MTVKAYITHNLKGRIRIKIPTKKQDMEFLERCAEMLCQHPEIFEVKSNAVTASLLVLCQPGLSVEQLSDYCQRSQLLDISTSALSYPSLNQQIAGQINVMDNKLQRLSEGEVDVKSALFIVMLGLTIHQFINGQRLGPATTLFWQALSLLPLWNGNKKL